MSNGQHIYTARSASKRRTQKRKIISNSAAGIHPLLLLPPPSLPASDSSNSSQITLQLIHRNSKTTAYLLTTLLFLSFCLQFILLSYHHNDDVDEYAVVTNNVMSSVGNELIADMELLDEEMVDILNAAYEYNTHSETTANDNDDLIGNNNNKNDNNNNNGGDNNNYNDVDGISSETIRKFDEDNAKSEDNNNTHQKQGDSQQQRPALADFCGTCRFRDQDFNCNHRIDWVMKNNGKTEEEAKMASLQYCLKEKELRRPNTRGGNSSGDAAALLKSGNNWVTDKHKPKDSSTNTNNQAPYKLLPKSNWDQYSMDPINILQRAGVDYTEGYTPQMKMTEARKALRQNIQIEKQEAQLPTVQEIQSLYGTKPYILGLDRCQAYRDAVDPEFRLIGPAGLFNSATNLLSQLLRSNCMNNARLKTKKYRPKDAPTGVKIQAPWGKHNPVFWRLHHEAKVGGAGTNQEEFLPIVMIKDPLTWMASMCRHSYEARWRHISDHCPNLVANQFDKGKKPGEIMPVFVKFATKHIGDEALPDPKNRTFIKYDSLLELWNRWYTEWTAAEFPRLMVRFEDLLFHAEETISEICDCAGGTMRPRFRYVEDSAKGDSGPHAGSAGFLASLVTYGNSTKRMKDILTDEADYEFAKENLDEMLMKEFGYAPL